jgi:hypothetical protein
MAQRLLLTHIPAIDLSTQYLISPVDVGSSRGYQKDTYFMFKCVPHVRFGEVAFTLIFELDVDWIDITIFFFLFCSYK